MYGWASEKEDREFLRDAASKLCFSYKDLGTLPEEYRPKVQVENQGPIGSCRGHSTSTCAEVDIFNQSGKIVQLSRMFSYLTGQKLDGLLGRDSGSTISGGIQAAQKYGICLEEQFPYPNPVRYTTQIPQSAYEEASNFRLRAFADCKNYDDVLTFLAGKAGGVSIGVEWNDSWVKPVVERVSSGGGGHAVSLIGWSKKRDFQKRPYLWLANSWGDTQPFSEIAPAVIDQIISNRFTVMIGLSGMGDFSKPRVTYEEIV